MFKVGDRVRIKGDASDYTDHLDGMIGTIAYVCIDDCYVDVNNGRWIIWNYNMEVVSNSNG
jgi:hypothetical protein